MNFSKQAEKKFEIVSTEDPNLVGFKVALNSEFLVPSGMPALGDIYVNWAYKNPSRSTEWSNYVYARTEESNNETWFHFIPSLPSSIMSYQKIDPVWGLINVFEFLQNTTSTSLPAIGLDLTTYTPAFSGFCFDAKEQPIAKGLSKFIIESIATGIGYTNRRTTTTQLAMFWPAVMTDFQLITVLNRIDNSDGSYFKRIPVWRMRDAFSDPVSCEVSEWWQATAPVWGSGGLPTPSTTMQPAACEIQGNLMNLSIPECLHAEVVYSEQNALGTISGATPWVTISLKMLSFTWAATNVTEWPATFTKVFSEQQKGGYLCRTEVYSRPTVSGGALTYSSGTAWSLATHGYWYELR